MMTGVAGVERIEGGVRDLRTAIGEGKTNPNTGMFRVRMGALRANLENIVSL